MQSHSEHFFEEVEQIAKTINTQTIEDVANVLVTVRARGGRVFCLGVGGSAGNCSHMVNDLRKLCGIEAYAPTDNVSELSARTNDEGFDTIFSEWLKVSNFNEKDCIFILSVGGGNKQKNVSIAICNAIDLAKSVGAHIVAVVGKPDGYTYQMADHAVLIPLINPDRVTPHSEAFQAVVWHSLVCNPALQQNKTKW